MEIIKHYCGLTLISLANEYACIDVYEWKIVAKGTLAECEVYFDTYVDRVSNR